MSQCTKIPLKVLKEHIHYDPIKGVFTRLKSKQPGWKGPEKLTFNNARENAYRPLVRIGDKTKDLAFEMRAHRAVWFYMTGKWPNEDREIAVLDNNYFNLKWSNIKELPRPDNRQLMRRRKDNTSGVRGVTQSSNNGKWYAYIASEGVSYRSEGFVAKSKAVTWRKAKEAELYTYKQRKLKS